MLNTDQAPTYAAAIAQLEAEGKCPMDTRHRQVKYLNNVIEADHGKLEQLIRPVRGFKTLKTAYATIKGFEVMRALRKGQAEMFALQSGIVGEARIVERAFGVGPCALTEAMGSFRVIGTAEFGAQTRIIGHPTVSAETSNASASHASSRCCASSAGSPAPLLEQLQGSFGLVASSTADSRRTGYMTVRHSAALPFFDR